MVLVGKLRLEQNRQYTYAWGYGIVVSALCWLGAR